ncbi:unnamed protein product, partial [Meganyctiphanes norvegica]
WVTSDGAHLDDVPGLRSIIVMPGNSTLRLHPFSADHYRHDVHQATYRCLATNDVGTVTSRTAIVTAVVEQAYDVGVQDAMGVVGGTVVLTCDVSSTVATHVTTVAWTVEGRTITPSSRPAGRYWMLPSGELLIRGLTSSDEHSRITCTATHAFNPNTVTSNTARLIITGSSSPNRPQVMTRREVVRPWEGDELVLPCVARGNPQPQIRWYREAPGGSRSPVGGHRISGGGGGGRIRVMEGQLVLSPTHRDDSGRYTCTAENTHGSDTYTVVLSVRAALSVNVLPAVQR